MPEPTSAHPFRDEPETNRLLMAFPDGEAFASSRHPLIHVKEDDMPAKSAAQQKAAGAALAAKRGDIKKSELKGASKSMEKSMSETELEKMASTKRKGKPEHKTRH